MAIVLPSGNPSTSPASGFHSRAHCPRPLPRFPTLCAPCSLRCFSQVRAAPVLLWPQGFGSPGALPPSPRPCSGSYVPLSCPDWLHRSDALLRHPREALHFACHCSRTHFKSWRVFALLSCNPDTGQQVLVCLRASPIHSLLPASNHGFLHPLFIVSPRETSWTFP